MTEIEHNGGPDEAKPTEDPCGCQGSFSIDPETWKKVVDQHYQEQQQRIGKYGDFIEKMNSVNDYIADLYSDGKAEWFVALKYSTFGDERPPEMVVNYLQTGFAIFKKGGVPPEIQEFIVSKMAPYSVKFEGSGKIVPL